MRPELLLLPQQNSDADANPNDSEPVPTIDMRWWLGEQRRVGIDVGISYFNTAIYTSERRLAKLRIFYGKLGAPVALTTSQHTTIELIPQISYMGSGTVVPEREMALYRWDIALRLSAEIHFGFIDLPELSVQSGLGLSVVRQVLYNRVTDPFIAGPSAQRAVITEVGPYGGKGPWEVFIGNLTALYYF